MRAFAILLVMPGRGTFLVTVTDNVTGTFAALRASVIQTSARYRADRRNQAVEQGARTMFADKPSRVVLDRISLAEVAAQKPIFGDDFKVSHTRQPWPRF
jgi:hypothetical protein